MKTQQNTSVRLTALGVAAILGAACWLACGSTARAGLLSIWRLDETTGSTAPNLITGGFDGTLHNGAAWTYDDQRGQVAQFDGNDDYIDAGFIPSILTTDDFTASFWSWQDPAQGIDNDVILGNRYGGAGNSWLKATPRQLEYHPQNVSNHIDYADVPGGQWVHHTLTKSGTALSYYRNGVPGGTATVTQDMPVLPFYMGGDATAERWRGRIDDVALFDHVLSAGERTAVMAGDFSAYGVTRPTGMSDAFDGTAVDGAKWVVIDKGLESTVDGGYNPPAVGGGTLTLGGTTTHSYWAGKTLRSTDSYVVPDGGEVQFDVDRVSLTGSGSAWRSSMWMFADNGHYLHFSQNIGETNWQYNAGNQNPTGSGIRLNRGNSVTDGGQHKMTLRHDGDFVKMYLDGRWLGSQAANFDQFQVMLTGQARASGDTVAAVFDNAAVSTRVYENPIYDNFNTGTIGAGKWEVIAKGLENQGVQGSMTATIEDGELLIQGSTGAQYWHGLTLRNVLSMSPNAPATFAVDRDTMIRGGSTAVRTGVWVWADDDHFLFFGHNLGENGWQYNYEDGPGVGAPAGGGVNIGALDYLDGDEGAHELKVSVYPDGAGALLVDMFLDGGSPVATQSFSNWGDLPYHFMISAMPRASGDTVFAAFDNVQLRVPEPTTWLLLSLGGLALMLFRRRLLKR